jgi:signal transduction histidine kinase
MDVPSFWTFPDIVHPDDSEEVRRQLHLTAGGGGTFDAKFRFIHPDGGEKLVHGIVRREAVDDDGEIRIIGAFVDISGYQSTTGDIAQSLTEAEAARAEAKTAHKEAEAANRAKSNFLAIMSHELRTPLNSILGFSEIIKNQMFGPIGTQRYADYADDIRESGELLLSIINDILDLAKIEAGHLELNEEPVDLLTVMQDATKLIQERADAKGILLKISLPQDLPMIRADGRLVRQMADQPPGQRPRAHAQGRVDRRDRRAQR